ncbi:thioester reductase domain-containing protein [Hyalangium sp.]|uniref:thioester reductase domain-containing protein n=1 Tax=Hyalangium sp. TaxID=2028555 RepID=UPI002D329694|nr:thioester reductase domain-containing protein [Hyalangium sp.]HYH98168.1 thioester reductase domain-containing protein [Hyalangium sp.]
MSAPTRAANEPLISTSVSGLRTALASFAREHLPEAMVPTRFVILDELPKLPNGKVDRSRLPTRDAGEPAGTTYLPPSTPEEIRIAQIWRDVLGVSRVGVEDSFFDLGGDSLAAAQMAARVKEEFGVALSLRRLFEHPTVTELARMVGAKALVGAAGTGSPRSLSNEDLFAEAQLPADIVPAPDAVAPASAPYRTILLTGATGYTGAYLLREILEHSEARVYALARAKDARDAVNRVRRNLASYGLWRDSYESRVVGVAGDLGRPYFGVSRPVYEELAEQVEMIVHNGALSSYALPYRRLKAVNVLGTQEVLRLACKRRIKPLHFISSLAVFPGHPGVHHFKEVEVTDPVNVLGGYRQTKWVSDRLVTLAGHRGLPVSIYRPGLITGAQDTGACSTDTFLNAAMKGCIQLGAALDFDVMLEMVPVDFCAKAVAHIALSGKRHGMRFHLPSATPMRWSRMLDLLEECGYPLRRVPYQTWYRELAAAVEQGADNALTRFFPLFAEDMPSADVGYPDSEPHFATDNLEEALAGSGIACRPMDASFLSLYLEYFVSTGYLPPPTRQGTRGGGVQP